jgi:hypothetical protein
LLTWRRIGFTGRLVHAGLVGEDHDLDAIAEPELHQEPLDVRPGRRLLDDERGGDLAVREPRATRSRTCRSRGVSASSLA